MTLPNFALVAAVRESDTKVPLVKQYRHGAKRDFWELPAGLLERDEKPEECVKREFREEVGYELVNPELLTSVFTSPARTAQIAHIFSGTVGKRSRKRLDANEALTTKFVTKASALKLLSRNISATHLLAYLIAQKQQPDSATR